MGGRVEWAASTLLSAVLGAGLLVALTVGQPTPMSDLYGTCPAVSADPLSVCYDAGAAAAQAARDVWTVEQLEAGHDCVTAGRPGQVPAMVVLAAGGRIVRMPFPQAWTAVHGPAATRVYAQCYR